MVSEAVSMESEPAVDAERVPDATVLRAQQGDLAAFEDLMHRHQRLVFGTARSLLGVSEDAEDAAQEVFLRLYQHLERIDPARPLGAWLYRVTTNVCRSFGRWRRARPTVALGETAGELRAVGGDPAAAAELEEEQRMVARGLETLARQERTAMVLHDLEGLSVREVAAALSVSEVTVRTHLCRARQKMRAFRERWHGRIPR